MDAAPDNWGAWEGKTDEWGASGADAWVHHEEWGASGAASGKTDEWGLTGDDAWAGTAADGNDFSAVLERHGLREYEERLVEPGFLQEAARAITP